MIFLTVARRRGIFSTICHAQRAFHLISGRRECLSLTRKVSEQEKSEDAYSADEARDTRETRNRLDRRLYSFSQSGNGRAQRVVFAKAAFYAGVQVRDIAMGGIEIMLGRCFRRGGILPGLMLEFGQGHMT